MCVTGAFFLLFLFDRPCHASRHRSRLFLDFCVASALPSIGGLGFREAGAAYFFSRIGVDSGIAVSISFMTFLFMVAVGLMGGAIYVLTLSFRRIQYHSSN